MIWKFLIAVAVAYAGWWLWRLPVVRQDRFRKPVQRPTNIPAVISEEAAEAREILGVPANADEATIRAAHRRLITAVHPDRGGSAELTRRVNAARDILLKQIRT